MTKNNPTNVSSAFVMLLKEIEAEIDLINGVGANAFEEGDYDKANEALEQASKLVTFRDAVSQLHDEWKKLAGKDKQDSDTKGRKSGRQSGTPAATRPRGGITPEPTYRPLILEILQKHGGAAKTRDIKAELETRLGGSFTEKDLKSHQGECPVWWNRAMWERLKMVKEGLMLSNSRKGVWEISPAGLEYLRHFESYDGKKPSESI